MRRFPSAAESSLPLLDVDEDEDELLLLLLPLLLLLLLLTRLDNAVPASIWFPELQFVVFILIMFARQILYLSPLSSTEGA